MRQYDPSCGLSLGLSADVWTRRLSQPRERRVDNRLPSLRDLEPVFDHPSRSYRRSSWPNHLAGIPLRHNLFWQRKVCHRSTKSSFLSTSGRGSFLVYVSVLRFRG